ncbi:hypothetical protein SAMN02910418_02191 [Bowdeniella nasicola]|uniref:Uncharacterized protein n=1 Tax=Bowdeniella nasicola TaxID=208480 RepID=A0A1H4DBG1_9ACTO|nr:hypothetical protein [Bowdeniella nasicola]SEA70064.1 hypothetical protein SAMN02910418_02191 [Bowdeniella nasicola]
MRHRMFAIASAAVLPLVFAACTSSTTGSTTDPTETLPSETTASNSTPSSTSSPTPDADTVEAISLPGEIEFLEVPKPSSDNSYNTLEYAVREAKPGSKELRIETNEDAAHAVEVSGSIVVFSQSQADEKQGDVIEEITIDGDTLRRTPMSSPEGQNFRFAAIAVLDGKGQAVTNGKKGWCVATWDIGRETQAKLVNCYDTILFKLTAGTTGVTALAADKSTHTRSIISVVGDDVPESLKTSERVFLTDSGPVGQWSSETGPSTLVVDRDGAATEVARFEDIPPLACGKHLWYSGTTDLGRTGLMKLEGADQRPYINPESRVQLSGVSALHCAGDRLFVQANEHLTVIRNP